MTCVGVVYMPPYACFSPYYTYCTVCMLMRWSPVTLLYGYVCLSSYGWMLHQAGRMCIVSSVPGDLLQAGGVLVIDWFTYILLPNFPAAPGRHYCLADWLCSCLCAPHKRKCSRAHASQQSRCQVQVAPLSVCVTLWKQWNARQVVGSFKAVTAVSNYKRVVKREEKIDD